MLGRFCDEHSLGWTFKLLKMVTNAFPDDPGMVRKPDVSFVRFGCFPGGVAQGLGQDPPDLAVEVLFSLTTRHHEARTKSWKTTRQAGVRLVWVINPNSREP